MNAINPVVPQGIYHGDSRDGEGMMTYPGGRQDVGVWKGTKLVQLKFAVGEASFDPSSSNSLPCDSLDSPDWKSRGNHGPKGPLEVCWLCVDEADECTCIVSSTPCSSAGSFIHFSSCAFNCIHCS